MQSEAHVWTVSVLENEVIVTTGNTKAMRGDFCFEYVAADLSSLTVVAFAGLNDATISCDNSLASNNNQLQQTTAIVLGEY